MPLENKFVYSFAMFVHLLHSYNKNIYESTIILYNIKNTLPLTALHYIYRILSLSEPKTLFRPRFLLRSIHPPPI
jgi:hypothetical protein